GHEQKSVMGHGDPDRMVEPGIPGDPVAAAARASGDRRHLTIWSDLADSVVAGVGDKNVAACIDGETRRGVELCRLALTVAETGYARSRKRLYKSVRRDHPDPIVVGIGDKDSAAGRHGDSKRPVKLCLIGRSIEIPGLAASRDSTNLTVSCVFEVY